MDIAEHDLSDDGHFLSDTDDEYQEDFEDEDGEKTKLCELDEKELLRLATVNAEAAEKAGKEHSAVAPSTSEMDKQFEVNRNAWLLAKAPIIGKKLGKKKAPKPPEKTEKSDHPPKTEEEADLEKLAFQEILREAKRGKERSEEMGSSGWQKPKVPPTNKRFLQNTLLSTLPRKRRRQSEDRDAPSVPTCDSSGAAGVKCEETEVDEGIKPEIDEKINEYRKQLAQNYEDEKHHRRQKAEESKIFNKASARALKRAEVEKKKFDQVMRYGVKVGAKKERVAQGKKKAIFDRYRGVWKPLDKTYHKPESHSDSDSNTEEPPSDYIRHDFRRGMDREDCPGEFHPRDRGGRDGEAWNAYTAAMYNYYYHQYQQKYDIVPSSGREYGGREYYKYESDQSEDSVKKYEHRSRRRPNDHTDETDSSESGNKKTRKHKSKRQKHKKQKKSKKSKKSSKAKRRTQESSDSEGSGLSQRRKKRKVASDVEDMFCGSHEPDTVANSERFSQSNDEAGETNSQSLTVTVGGSDSDDESRRGKKSKHKSKHRKSRT